MNHSSQDLDLNSKKKKINLCTWQLDTAVCVDLAKITLKAVQLIELCGWLTLKIIESCGSFNRIHTGCMCSTNNVALVNQHSRALHFGAKLVK